MQNVEIFDQPINLIKDYKKMKKIFVLSLLTILYAFQASASAILLPPSKYIAGGVRDKVNYYYYCQEALGQVFADDKEGESIRQLYLATARSKFFGIIEEGAAPEKNFKLFFTAPKSALFNKRSKLKKVFNVYFDQVDQYEEERLRKVTRVTNSDVVMLRVKKYLDASSRLAVESQCFPYELKVTPVPVYSFDLLDSQGVFHSSSSSASVSSSSSSSSSSRR